MNKRLLSIVLALAVAFFGGNLTFLNASSHESGGHDHTHIEEEMETISKSFRTIRRQAKDPSKNAESAELAGKMLAAAKEAINHEPVWTQDQPASEQADFVKGFKKEMEKFIGMLVDLEKAFKSGDNAAAEKIIGDLRQHQKDSHKTYKKPDDD